MKIKILILFIVLLFAGYAKSQCAGNCTLYTVASIPVNLSPNAGTALVLGDDQLSAALPIGFTFTFMCNAYTSLYVSSNGFLSFSNVSSGCCSGQTCPTALGNPNNYVAFAWNDLYPPGAGTINYQTLGVAPNRIFVLTYSLIPFCCSAGPPNVSGQIKLYETTNVIEVHNAVVGNQGSNQTQGIMDATGTVGIPAPGRNAVPWTANNDAYRWTPSPTLPACTTAPGAGNAIASPTTGCLTLTTSLSLTGTTGTCSATYQWQSATNIAGPYTNIAGATNQTATATCSVTTYFRCILTCGTATAASTPATGSITPGPCPACTGTCNVYIQTSIPYNIVPSGGTSLVLSDDVLSAACNIGFTFNYMCTNYTQMYVSSNGFISFNPACSQGCCSGGIIPTAAGNPNNFVAFLWTDLYPPGAGSITYQTLGVAPNRICVITYSNIPYFFNTGSVTGQIKLFETTNIIQVHSASASVDTHLKTQGIEDVTGAIGSAVAGRNGVNFSIATPDAYQWAPGCVVPLAVELTDYYLNYSGEYSDINWTTSSEKNSDYFIIEKSIDGISYSAIANVKAAGNSSDTRKYSTRDQTPNKYGTTYYRLKQFDKGSEVSKLNLVKTLILKEESLPQIKIQPNPASTNLDIYLPESFLNRNVTLQLFDNTGSRISKISFAKFSSNSAYTLNVEGLPNGVYFIQILDENGSSVSKTFIKN